MPELIVIQLIQITIAYTNNNLRLVRKIEFLYIH